MTTTQRSLQDDRDRDRRAAAAGAVSVRGKTVRKTPFGWLPWTALLLAGILGLGALLIARNVGDAGDKPGVDLTDNRAAKGQDPPGPDANANDGSDSGSAPDAKPSAQPAAPAAAGNAANTSLTVNGTPLLPVPADLASLSGGEVSANGARVESVVADEGFWVGNDTTNRVFVYLTPAARSTKGESPFQVQAGQRVNLAGSLKPVPNDLTPFGVDRSEGADQLRQQGQYVEATSIALS